MRRYFIITIDTECDNQWDKALKWNISLENIKEIPRLQKLFNRLKVRPCYLITYPVATYEYSISMFREFLDGSICEVGSHLHPWTTPPILDNETRYQTFLHLFPKHVQKEKFENLHNVITDNLNVEPKSYRGGRYSFDSHMLEMLEEKSYLLDTSVTPFNDWSHIGGLDYVDCITSPYFPSKTNVLRRGDSTVLEVPVSIDFNKNIPHGLKKLILRMPLMFHVQGILKRLRLYKLIWLDPSFQTFLDMKTLVDLLFDGYKILCINLMFHSSVLSAGRSPYNKTEEEVSNFYHRLESIISYMIKEMKMTNLIPKEFAEIYSKV